MRPTFDMDWLDDFISFLFGLDLQVQLLFAGIFLLAISVVLYLAHLDFEVSGHE